jgi:hypothetical protein
MGPADRYLRDNRDSRQVPGYGQTLCFLLLVQGLEGTDKAKKDRKEPKGKEVKPQEWTVAVDLAVNFDNGLGGQHKLKQLKKIAELTKDKSVSIIAQVIVPNPAYSKDKKEGGPEFLLERYSIRDGKTTALKTVPSKGVATNITELLALASKEYPSNKLALHLDVHGEGNQGIHGDGGAATLKQVANAIERGLAEGKHKKVDLLDFDACLMGQRGVVAAVQRVARHVVASTEIEPVSKEKGEGAADGQNLQALLKGLLNNPKMGGDAYAEVIIEEAKAGANKERRKESDKPVRNGTKTLAHYDLEHYAEFQRSLDSFGENLCEAIKDASNRKAVFKAIRNTREIAPELITISGRHLVAHKRDLKDFAERIRSAVVNKEIKDPTGSLLKSARELLAKQTKLVKSYYGDEGYEKLGGLCVYLPTEDFLNTEVRSREVTSVGRVAVFSNPDYSPVKDSLKARKVCLNRIVSDIKQIEKDVESVPALKKDAQALKAACIKLRDTGIDSPEKFMEALKVVNSCATKLENSPEFQKMVEKKRLDYRKELDKDVEWEFNRELVFEGDGSWNRLRKQLAGFKK